MKEVRVERWGEFYMHGTANGGGAQNEDYWAEIEWKGTCQWNLILSVTVK